MSGIVQHCPGLKPLTGAFRPALSLYCTSAATSGLKINVCQAHARHGLQGSLHPPASTSPSRGSSEEPQTRACYITASSPSPLQCLRFSRFVPPLPTDQCLSRPNRGRETCCSSLPSRTCSPQASPPHRPAASLTVAAGPRLRYHVCIGCGHVPRLRYLE